MDQKDPILIPRIALLAVNVAVLTLAFWMLKNGAHPGFVTAVGVLFNLVCIALDLRMLFLCRGSLTAGVFTVALCGWYLLCLVSFSLLPYGKGFIIP